MGKIFSATQLCLACPGHLVLNLIVSKEFIDALKKNQKAFGLNLEDGQIGQLDRYYKIVMENNTLLHLVAPCTAETFATRHILESLLLLEYLPNGARFADIGPGAGLPSIPCLIVRKDLKAVLIESSLKKWSYLTKALGELDLSKRAQVINKQFEETPFEKVDFVTSRALDKFSQKLPKIVKWARGARFLFYGGNNIKEGLEQLKSPFQKKLLPEKNNSYIFSGRCIRT